MTPAEQMREDAAKKCAEVLDQYFDEIAWAQDTDPDELAGRIDTAIRALPLPEAVPIRAELEAASQWQPIETAPKDGTWILAFDPEWGHQIVKWNFWFAPPDERGAFQTEDTYDRNIIAWMPLPTPPETKP
jgi:hypothetical protein